MPCQQNKCFSQVLQHYGQAQLVIPIPIVSAPIVSASSGASMAEVSGSSFGEATAGEDPAFMTERERLVWAMEQCGWVQAKAARLLNLTPRQIGYALSRYNIEVKHL